MGFAVRGYTVRRAERTYTMGKVHCVMIIVAHFGLCAIFTAAAILDEQDSFWIDMFYVLMAMAYALSALLFGRWSFEWFSLFAPQNASDYGMLLDDDQAPAESIPL